VPEIDRGRLATVHAAERRRFAREHPRSRALFERAQGSLVSGVPMTWMAKWAGRQATTSADADRHTEAFSEAVAALV